MNDSSPHDCCAAEETPAAMPRTQWIKTYFPLLLIFAYLLGVTGLAAMRADDWSAHALMSTFMGAFFLTFSFFKLLDLRGFADAYRTYDLVARALPAYGLLYPFIELCLGVAYLASEPSFIVHAITAGVMAVSSLGVLQALTRKQAIECACLGTVFKLPMTQVTLFEDLLMLAMALWMLL